MVTAMQLGASRESHRIAVGILVAGGAAVSANYLSGINFPEANNVWHIPAVLNFAESQEGPSDPYHASYKYFISLYWKFISTFTAESNIERVFVATQLVSNALYAIALYIFSVNFSRTTQSTAVAVAFLCFCHGAWSLTRLGYSELFITYATHTQFSITACILALLFVVRRHFAFAGALLGIAADLNLFMAFWSSIAVALYVVISERQKFVRPLLTIGSAAALCSIPVLFWTWEAFSESLSVSIDPSFYRTFIAGHVYGTRYPQALLQTFSLAIVSAIALASAPEKSSQRTLGIVLAITTAVLLVATAMPEIWPSAFWTRLAPLRFTSIVISLCMIAAATIMAGEWCTPRAVWAVIAIGGFLFKLPAVSIIGFALLIAPTSYLAVTCRWLLPTIGLAAMYIPAPPLQTGYKGALASAILSLGIAIAIVSVRHSDTSATNSSAANDGHFSRPLVGVLVWILSASITELPLQRLDMVAVGSAIAAWTLLQRRETAKIAAVAVAVGCAAVLARWLHSSFVFTTLGLGLLAILLSAKGSDVLRRRQIQVRHLAATSFTFLVTVLVATGLAKGARDGYWTQQTPQQADFLEAQRWARAETPRGSVFYAHQFEGFSLFSRRESWWESTHMPAILWSPSLHPMLTYRRECVTAAAGSLEKIIALAVRENIDYVVLPSNLAGTPASTKAQEVFSNRHIKILKILKS